jgi:SprT-like family
LRRGAVDPTQLLLLLDAGARGTSVPRPLAVAAPPAGRRTGDRRGGQTGRREDDTMVAKLQARHAEYNATRFGGALRPIRIDVSRRLRRRLGYYRLAAPSHPPMIVVSRRHVRRDGWDEACQTLLHEMIHQWQEESGLPVDHGVRFRARARAVGAVPRARRPVRANESREIAG